MSGKTSPAQLSISVGSFYGESPPKRSRLHDTNNIRPTFKTFNDQLVKFDKKLSEPIKNAEPKEQEQVHVTDINPIDDSSKNLDRDSPVPLKNLGNTCYENSIIQCLFGLSMFMDNFEESMDDMRQFVVKSKVKSFNVLNNENDDQEPSQNDSDNKQVTTITQDDVRYRITDAFDRLYKSYTRRRAQLEAKGNNNVQEKSSDLIESTNLDLTTIPPDFAISHSSSAIPLCKSTNSSDNQSPLKNDTCHNTSEPDSSCLGFPSKTSITTDPLSTSLTPVALVSSTAAITNEQSEVETRLEHLKSAVGERSSQFNSTHQQDASEFFYHVIDSIQEFYQSLNKTNDDDNPVTKAFELELDYLIRCPKCHHKIMSGPEKIRTLPLALPHVNNENIYSIDNPDTNDAPTPPNSDLGLDSPKSSLSDEPRNGSDEKENQALVDENMPSDNSNTTMSIAKLELADRSEASSHNQHLNKHYTLGDALNNYFKDDLLEYSCSQQDCDSKIRTKKYLIRKLPQILFITLARYSYTGKKSLDEIEAPFELSVPFLENKSPSHSPSIHRDIGEGDNRYQLVAVVCHLGSSLNAGHYTSYVYNQNNFSWYSCDDDSITKVQEAEVKNDASKSGYCFFYAHKSSLPQKSNTNEQQSICEKSAPEQLVESKAMSVSQCFVASSVILTPEASPKSISPVPSTNSQEDSEMCDIKSVHASDGTFFWKQAKH